MHNLIAPYVEKGLVTKKKHPTLDLYLFDYSTTCQFEKAWDEITRVCRGLVLDGEGSIVSRCFPKFFNVEEHEGPLPPLDQAKIYDKIDGSLIIATIHDFDLLVNTRGSFTSPQTRAAYDLLMDGYGGGYKQFELGWTYLFEYTSPWNRIVVNHGEDEKLTLLAKIETATGREEDVTFVYEWDGPRVPRTIFFDESQLTWENLKADRDNHEGWVLFWPDQGLRLKVKHPFYVYLHRMLTRTSAVDIWECLRRGQDLREHLAGVPDEWFAWARQTEADLRARFEAAKFDAERTFFQIIRPQGSPPTKRKEFAAAVQQCTYPHKSALYALWDDKDIDDILWKTLKPKATSPFIESGQAGRPF